MHSSHSSETPLQPALTSQLRERIRRRGNSETAQTERLPATASCAEQPRGFLSSHSRPLRMSWWKVSAVAIFCVIVVRTRCLPTLPHVKLFRRRAVHDVKSCVRCQPRAQRSAAARLPARDVPQASASCRTAADAAQFARGSSSRTAVSRSRAIAQRDWSATTEGCAALRRASVGVESTSHSPSSVLFPIQSSFSYFTSAFLFLGVSQIRREILRVRQQDLPEWRELPSEL